MAPIIITLFASGVGNIILLLLLLNSDTKYQNLLKRYLMLNVPTEDHKKFLKVFSPEARKSIKACSDFIKDIEKK